MKGYKEITPEHISENVFELIGKRWMFITAGGEAKCNTMTASWGGMGVLWGKPVATVYIRPQRYTNEFVEANDRLTISFVPEQFRKALAYCGAHSGREGDKISAAGLNSAVTQDGVPYIAQADMVLQCRKMYVDKLDGAKFINQNVVEQWYPEKDFHYIYVCEIEHIYVKE